MVPGPIRATTSMIRPLIAAAILIAAVIGGFALGAVWVLTDTAADW